MTNTSDDLFVAWYRCAVDGREHAVTDDDFSTGMWNGSGRYRSLCGHQVTMDTTLAEPAPECVRCGTIVVAHGSAASSEHRGGRSASPTTRRLRAAITALFAPRRPLQGDGAACVEPHNLAHAMTQNATTGAGEGSAR